MTKALELNEVANRQEAAKRDFDENPVVRQMMDKLSALTIENRKLYENLTKISTRAKELERENRDLTYLLGHRIFRFFFRD